MKTPNTKPTPAINIQKPSKSFRFKKFLIWLGAIITVFIVSTLALSVNSMREFGRLQDVLASNRQIVEAAGGYELGPAHTNGGLWWFNNIICIDVVCPSAQQRLVVPLEPTKEGDFLTKTLIKPLGRDASCNYSHFEGWKPSYSVDGEKNGFHASVTIGEADMFHHNLPDRDVSPKIWRSIFINIY